MRVDSHDGGASFKAGGGLRLIYGGRCWPEGVCRLWSMREGYADIQAATRQISASGAKLDVAIYDQM